MSKNPGSLPLVALLLAFSVALPPDVHAADATAVAAAKSALASAVNAGDAKSIVAARGTFAALAAAEPTVTAFDYWTALAAWRAVPLLDDDDAAKAQAKKLCKDAIDRCNRVIKAEPNHADAMALKAGLQGLWLSFDPGAMMTLGMEMGQTMERASELAPGNGRVAFLDGLNTLHKPSFVGGGPGKARARFDEAIVLFEKSAPAVAAAAATRAGDPNAFDWGHDDAYVWAGRAAMKEKKYADAKAYYERALAANPSNGWVKHQLLPQAEKQLAGKASS